MASSGRPKRVSSFAVVGVIVAVMAACGTPHRDFPVGAGAGGNVSAGEGGSNEHGIAGRLATGGGTGHGAAGDPGYGGEAGSGGEPSITECVASAQRLCAQGGLLGSCASGMQTCSSDGHWGACSIVAKAKDGCATGNDDSCNGIPNEGCGCIVGQERPCPGTQGNCASGKQTCPDGSWSACSVVARAEDNCTAGDDANCNGRPNEGCGCKSGATQPCGPAAVGNCKPGTSTCVAEVWGDCIGAVVATKRDCTSSADNDCNGVPDNATDAVCFCKPTTSQACLGHAGLDGKGICRAGSQVCNAAADKASSSWSSCAGSVAPAARNCSSAADNNCDGSPDNTIDGTCKCTPNKTQACDVHAGLDGKGVCHAGSQSCSAAADGASSDWGSCTGSVGPGARSCASASDNDCNGVADNTADNVCQCNPSVAQSCMSGGSCIASGAGDKCACANGFNGAHCEFTAFRGIGVLGAAGVSYVNNISGDGNVVIGTSGDPVRSTNGGPLEDLGLANGSSPVPYALDTGGEVFAEGDGHYKYLNGTWHELNVSPYSSVNFFDVSRDGKVVVGNGFDSSTSSSVEAFVYSASGTSKLIGSLSPGNPSYAIAVSSDASVVVGYEQSFDVGGRNVAWKWTGNSLIPLPTMAGWGDRRPTDVSTDGKVAVGFANINGNTSAVKWSGTSATNLGLGTARRTNQDGSVVVGDDGNGNAMVWTDAPHRVSDLLGLTPSGWSLASANAVSDDGKYVAGDGTHNGRNEGWIAHLP